LYDLAVINPDGQRAIVPYRFQVARAIPPEVTIGVGGPRAILAGDTGTYSVALQSFSNLDTPMSFPGRRAGNGFHDMLYDCPTVLLFQRPRRTGSR